MVFFNLLGQVELQIINFTRLTLKKRIFFQSVSKSDDFLHKKDKLINQDLAFINYHFVIYFKFTVQFFIIIFFLLCIV